MIHQLSGRAPHIAADAYVAPSADVIGAVTLEAGASVWFGAVLRADLSPIKIGRSSNIQDGCVIHVEREHPTTIGEYVTVGHGAVIHGATIGNRVLIGMGAIILNGAMIGDGALIGAGALITPGTEVPPNAMVLGTPGKVVRDLGPQNAAKQQVWAEDYQRLWEDNYR